MKNLITLAVTAAALAFSSPAWAQSKGLVVFSQAGMENEWRVMNTKNMEKAFKDAGYDFVWTNANADPAKQLADIEDLLARKPVLLVVAPIEYEPLAPVPDMAKEAGVPLIVVDRALPGTPGEQWVALLTTDFVDTGAQVGKDVVEELTKKNGAPKGKLLHITGNKGASPVVDEQKGLDSVLKDIWPDPGRHHRGDGRTPARRTIPPILSRPGWRCSYRGRSDA